MKNFETWIFSNLNEDVNSTRYSVEITYRSKKNEVLDAYAKIALGYVSAAIKSSEYHVKRVFEEKPYRILISQKNFHDGEWIGIVSWNSEKQHFVISKGFYNKDRNTVSIQTIEDCKETSAAEISNKVINLMHNLKDQKDRSHPEYKPVPLKTGPK